jgi:DNA topoisomerase IB
VSAAIRQLGADVITGAPLDLPPAVSDRYIALKAAGRL